MPLILLVLCVFFYFWFFVYIFLGFFHNNNIQAVLNNVQERRVEDRHDNQKKNTNENSSPWPFYVRYACLLAQQQQCMCSL